MDFELWLLFNVIDYCFLIMDYGLSIIDNRLWVTDYCLLINDYRLLIIDCRLWIIYYVY